MSHLAIPLLDRLEANARLLRGQLAPKGGDDRWRQMQGRYDFGAALNEAANGEPLTGIAREVSDELARRAPLTTNNGFRVPLEFLLGARRVLTASPASAGGYLDETRLSDVQRALYPASVLAGLGATILEVDRSFNAPKMTGSATATWLAAETTQLAASNQALAQVAFTPNTVGSYTQVTRLLNLQSDASKEVAFDVGMTTVKALDVAGLQGAGGTEPTGLLNQAGVAAIAGGALTLATVESTAAAFGNALDPSLGAVTTPLLASALRQRAEIAGSSKTLWQGTPARGALADIPGLTTAALAAGSLYLGNWRYLWVALFFGGVEIAVDPYDNFQAGIIGIRALLSCDVNPIFPAAFAANAAPVT